MRIGGIGNIYPNFVYNTNTVDANSLNKLSRISENVLDKKVDYETNTEENQNPLRKGETKDFQSILAKQMQEGQNRAAAILPFGIAPGEETGAQAASQETRRTESSFQAEETAGNVQSQNTSESVPAVNETASENQAQNQQENQNIVSYQMQRAIQAYEMFAAV